MNGILRSDSTDALIERLNDTDGPLPPPGAWPQSLRTAFDIVRHSPTPMILLWGAQLGQLYNDAFGELIGNKHPQAFGQPVDVTWPELKAFNDQVLPAVLEGQVRTFSEKKFSMARGDQVETLWADLTYSPVLDESGAVAGVLVTAIAANERRRVQSELEHRSQASLHAQHALQERLQLALAATDAVGTWDWDIREDVFLADAHFAQMHRVDPSLAGKLPIGAYLEGVHPDDRVHVAQRIKACVRGNGEFAEEYRLLQPDGSWRWVFARGRSFKDSHHRPARFMGASIDITERKQMEQTLRDLNETLELRVAERTQALADINHRLQEEMRERERAEEALRHAQKMEAVGQLTGGIAHDFNNMLTGVMGSLDLMKRYLRDHRYEDIERFADAAITSAQRAAALTHRLLAFSRRQSLDRKRIDPNSLVESLHDLLARTTGEHINVQVSLGQPVWPVNTDANQLENALLNLAINARDAMPEGGVLEIETANCCLRELPGEKLVEAFSAGDYVVISVYDSGTGMSAPVLAKAFDPFFTTKPTGQGTGLGLSMIYGFVQQSGGHVTLTSEPGRGTCVRLYLPRHPEPASAAQTSERPEATPVAEEGESVLVVEDDPAVRMLILSVLDELGYRAQPAADAQVALPLLESALRIDLLITDVGLPGTDGRQLADIARLHRPGLKVLFMTGYTDKLDDGQAFKAEGMDIVSKPFTVEGLASKIRQLLGNRP